MRVTPWKRGDVGDAEGVGAVAADRDGVGEGDLTGRETVGETAAVGVTDAGGRVGVALATGWGPGAGAR